METIGDAYMVAAGLLDTPTQHAEAVTNMAFGMMEEAGKVMEPTNQSPLEVCMYIHRAMRNHGDCMRVSRFVSGFTLGRWWLGW